MVVKVAHTINTINEVIAFVTRQKTQNKTIALVPTMGGLHAGHLALVTAAKKIADVVVVSIFVNPAQFGDNEDLATYPCNLEEDKRLLDDYDINMLWLPSENDLYPLDENFSLVAPEVANQYCGVTRPVFFHGISLVVLKLLNIIRPHYAFFGQKDYQQLHIIKLMVKDFFLPTKIIGIKTVREKDGLAMSTRNQYLNTIQRQQALVLYQTLCWAKNQIEQKHELQGVKNIAISRLKAVFTFDYFAIINENTLQMVDKPVDNIRIITGVYLGKIRLIDNIKINYV